MFQHFFNFWSFLSELGPFPYVIPLFYYSDLKLLLSLELKSGVAPMISAFEAVAQTFRVFSHPYYVIRQKYYVIAPTISKTVDSVYLIRTVHYQCASVPFSFPGKMHKKVNKSTTFKKLTIFLCGSKRYSLLTLLLVFGHQAGSTCLDSSGIYPKTS